MLKVMTGFIKGMLLLKKPWVVWIGLLMATNMIVPIFFISTLEAKVVLAASIIGAGIQMTVFRSLGFVRLMGIGHIHWIPMVLWLWSSIDPISVGSPFEIWLLVTIILNSLSLIIDAADIFSYINGKRTPTITMETAAHLV